MKRNIYKLFSRAKRVSFALVLTGFGSVAYSQATYTFNYTGGVQTVTLGVGNYEIQCWGANGGSITSAGGQGTGGYSRGDINISTPGTTLNILVGGQGLSAAGTSGSPGAGGWNGGGGGGKCGRTGAGGGGATDVRLGGIAASNRIIVAGGGGGAAYYNQVAAGGNGGAVLGQNGDIVTSGGVTTTGGGGAGANGNAPGLSPNNFVSSNGTATGGGGGGQSSGIGSGQPGTGGGPGGYPGGSGSGATGSSGGGGGGYAGGAGGTQTSNVGAAGGGGSGYIGGVTNGITVRLSQTGFVPNPVTTGNGLVIIRELCSISLTASGSNSLNPAICSGQSLTLSSDAVSNYSWSTGMTGTNQIIVSPSVTTTYTLGATSASNCTAYNAITVTVSPGVPVLTISASSNSICLGDSINITAQGALTYTYSGGVVPGVWFYPSSTQTYSVSGGNGCGTTSSSIPVTVTPLPIFAVSSPTLVCASRTSTLSGGGALTYTWHPVPNPNGISGQNVVVAPAANTIYSVTGQVGNCFGQTTVEVQTQPNPTVNIAASASLICEGESVTMSLAGAQSYMWLNQGVSGTQVTVTPNAPTAYNVIGTAANGCTASAQQVVVVYPSPTLVTTSTPSLICAGASASLSVSGADSYSWSTGSQGTGVIVSPLQTTNYVVTGTASINGCTSTHTVTVNVYQATIAVSPVSASICPGESIQLTAGAASSYAWAHGGNQATTTVSPTTKTVYTINAVSTEDDLSCNSTNTVEVDVYPQPTVAVNSSTTMLCKNQTVTLTATGNGTFKWTTGSTSSSVTIKAVLVAPIHQTVTLTDANGCKATDAVTVLVSSCVGLAEQTATAPIKVYPNPNNGSFTIDAGDALNISIMNELGQVVKTYDAADSHHGKLKVEGLAKGIYLIHAFNENRSLRATVIIE